jgi:hypothetical protein
VRRDVGIFVALTLLAAACTSGSHDTAPATDVGAVSESSRTSESEPVPYEIPVELEFTATLVGGEPFDGTSVAGQDVLFWFWTPT